MGDGGREGGALQVGAGVRPRPWWGWSRGDWGSGGVKEGVAEDMSDQVGVQKVGSLWGVRCPVHRTSKAIGLVWGVGGGAGMVMGWGGVGMDAGGQLCILDAAS